MVCLRPRCVTRVARVTRCCPGAVTVLYGDQEAPVCRQVRFLSGATENPLETAGLLLPVSLRFVCTLSFGNSLGNRRPAAPLARDLRTGVGSRPPWPTSSSSCSAATRSPSTGARRPRSVTGHSRGHRPRGGSTTPWCERSTISRTSRRHRHRGVRAGGDPSRPQGDRTREPANGGAAATLGRSSVPDPAIDGVLGSTRSRAGTEGRGVGIPGETTRDPSRATFCEPFGAPYREAPLMKQLVALAVVSIASVLCSRRLRARITPKGRTQTSAAVLNIGQEVLHPTGTKVGASASSP